ncbi:MAG: energy transducer TonB, partial [Bacteroidota bacterium]
QRQGEYCTYKEDGSLVMKGQYLNGAREGEWITFLSGDSIVEVYEDEEPLVADTLGDSSRSTYRTIFAYTEVELMPQFPGGETGLMNFLGKNIKYPKQARFDGAQGTTYSSFIISQLGEIEDIKIETSIHSAIDSEVIRVIRLMPNWQPGVQNGVAVKVQYNLPIRMTMR